MNAVNSEDKENKILSQKTSNWQHKEEKRSVFAVDPTDFLCVIWFVTLEKFWHRKSVNKISQQDNDEWEAPGIIWVKFQPLFAGAGGQERNKSSADVKTDHVHTEERYKEEIVRPNADKQTDGVRVLDVKTKEKENLSNKQRANQAEEISGWVTLSEFLQTWIDQYVEKEEYQTARWALKIYTKLKANGA